MCSMRTLDGMVDDRRRLFGLPARLAAPFDTAEEARAAPRSDGWASSRSWRWSVVGVAILLSLTLAGEKCVADHT